MKRSTNRILTTHTGSLPRPSHVVDLLLLKNRDALTDLSAFDDAVRTGVREVAAKQVSVGLDVINDGEMAKASFYVYVKDRLTGFEGANPPRKLLQEEDDFPEFSQRLMESNLKQFGEFRRPACNGPIRWKDFAAVELDIENFKLGLPTVDITEAFMSSASPGTIADFLTNDYYATEDEYLEALVNVMRDEYEAIVNAGLILQLDCPDLAFRAWAEPSLEDHRRKMTRSVEALNEATKSIPAERMRMHVCWGNLEGPHHLDVPLKDIVDIVLQAKPVGLSVEGANPRHEHEWNVWKEVRLPPDKILIPGVIDTTTNFIEHPEVVAERIVRYASVVGRENVIASTDCGFATNVAVNFVDGRIAWAKLQSLVDGARIASEELW
jgi:5-methyltetrahydropteroyltriglutamate--homocysteine methyltransferase